MMKWQKVHGDKDTSIFTGVQPEGLMTTDVSQESWDKEPIKYLWTSVRLPGEPQKYLENISKGQAGWA